jgi:hypothetical protein
MTSKKPYEKVHCEDGEEVDEDRRVETNDEVGFEMRKD